MAKKEAKGRIWFKETVCKNCTNSGYCDQYGTDDLVACIEAEKLRFLKNGCLDVNTGEF